MIDSPRYMDEISSGNSDLSQYDLSSLPRSTRSPQPYVKLSVPTPPEDRSPSREDCAVPPRVSMRSFPVTKSSFSRKMHALTKRPRNSRMVQETPGTRALFGVSSLPWGTRTNYSCIAPRDSTHVLGSLHSCTFAGARTPTLCLLLRTREIPLQGRPHPPRDANASVGHDVLTEIDFLRFDTGHVKNLPRSRRPSGRHCKLGACDVGLEGSWGLLQSRVHRDFEPGEHGTVTPATQICHKHKLGVSRAAICRDARDRRYWKTGRKRGNEMDCTLQPQTQRIRENVDAKEPEVI